MCFVTEYANYIKYDPNIFKGFNEHTKWSFSLLFPRYYYISKRHKEKIELVVDLTSSKKKLLIFHINSHILTFILSNLFILII